MGRIKAKLTEQIPQPVPIQVEGWGEILVFPPTLEEQASITAAKEEEKNPGKAVTMMVYHVLRQNDPEVTYQEVRKMNILLPENQALVEGIGKVMEQFTSFRSNNSGQQQP